MKIYMTTSTGSDVGADTDDEGENFQVFRYKCGCTGDGNDCAERGGYQYIIVKENAEDSVVIPFNGHRIDQRNKSFYTGALEARYIDMCSSVPQIEDHELPSEISENLEDQDNYEKFQRKLDPSRPPQMGKFWGNVENHLVNAVTLGVESQQDGSHPLVEINEFGIEGVPNEFVQFSIIAHRPVTDGADMGWYDTVCGYCGRNVREVLYWLKNHEPNIGDHWTQDRQDSVNTILDLGGFDVEGEEAIPGNRLLSDFCLIPGCPGHLDKGIANSPNTRKRPLLALDGQHRIRGSQSGDSQKSELPHDRVLHHITGVKQKCPLNIPDHQTAFEQGDPNLCDCSTDGDFGKPTTEHKIPFTILTSDFDRKQQGRLFTDITTEAEPMSPNHQLYMLYRYEMKRPIKFGTKEVEFDFTSSTKTDYKAYVTLLRLTRQETMLNRINPLGGTLHKHWSTSIQKAMEMMNKIWDKAFSIYTNVDGHPSQAAKAIDMVFEAFAEVFGDTDPNEGDPEPYWSNSIEQKGVISSEGRSTPDDTVANLAFKGIFLNIPTILWEAAARKYYAQADAVSYIDFITLCGGDPNHATFGDDYNVDSRRFRLLTEDRYRPHQIGKEHIVNVFEHCKWKLENKNLYGQYMPGTDDDKYAAFMGAEIEFMKGLADPEIRRPISRYQQEVEFYKLAELI